MRLAAILTLLTFLFACAESYNAQGDGRHADLFADPEHIDVSIPLVKVPLQPARASSFVETKGKK